MTGRCARAFPSLVPALAIGLACASPEPAVPPAPPSGAPEASAPSGLPAEPRFLPPGDSYLQPNVRDAEGSAGFMHVRREDMPLRVAIGYPKRAPKYAGRRQARERSIQAIRGWERAIQPYLPWFEIEFVEKDPDAPVQVKWRRRIRGAAGWGRMTWATRDGRLRVGGEMQVSTTPDEFYVLEIDEVEMLIAHEFGHVLGLGHCLDCDSAMNYSWQTRDRVFVTDTDVRTFLELVEQPLAFEEGSGGGPEPEEEDGEAAGD